MNLILAEWLFKDNSAITATEGHCSITAEYVHDLMTTDV